MSLELVVPAAFAAGFFGGAHCLGMCGAIVVMLEEGASGGREWPRRLFYNAGRLCCYALLGAAAAAVGIGVAAWPQAGPAVLRALAALLVVAMGVTLALDRRPLRRLEQAGAWLWRRLAPLSRHVLPVSSAPRAFGAGLLWGLLPCGLVYSAAALAATTADVPGAMLVMAAFWVGTMPALLVAALSAGRLQRWRREPRLRRATGLALVLVGAVALAMPYLHSQRGAAEDGHAQHGTVQAVSNQELSIPRQKK